MAKIKNPVQFSKAFNIPKKKFATTGAFDPILNADTKLFIDPLLVPQSSIKEMRKAKTSINQHFGNLLKLLNASKNSSDIAWRQAAKMMRYPEIAATCLGYGAASIRGSSLGHNLAERLLKTAKEIVDMGINDPDLFFLLPLIEEDIGPDLISDMTTNIIVKDLEAFTKRVIAGSNVPLEKFQLGEHQCTLPRNPSINKRTPVLLVPEDILRKLPVATDWDGVKEAASFNETLRNKVNKYIGSIFEAKSRKEKAKLRAQALKSKNGCLALMELIKAVPLEAYDIKLDPDSQLTWREALNVANKHPLTLKNPLKIDDVWAVVEKIVEQFEFLIEKRNLSRLLWIKDKPRHEKHAQMVFFAVADSYCKANNLDITPEAETGRGPVDFKFSSGHKTRLLVEVKLSTNSKAVTGYEKQLEIYKEGESTNHGIYILIDVGSMGKKHERINALRNQRIQDGLPVSKIVYIDGTIKESASN